MSNVMSQIARVTCRIEVDFGDGRSSVGTGFFVGFDRDESGKGGLVLVTNRHVVQGGTLSRIVLTAADKAGQLHHREVQIPDLQRNCIYHPDPAIDLACIGAGWLWDALAAQGLICQHRALELNAIPSDETSIGDVEEVLMIGYPSGLFDRVNNRPLVRRGVTATAYSFDYAGKPNFLIDAAVYPGSSGSPVLIANQGGFSPDGGLVLGTRLQLLGVTFAVHRFSADGEVKPIPIPAHTGAFSTTLIPMNLGYCVKARMLHALIDAARKVAQTGQALQNAIRPALPGSSSPFGGYLFP